MKTITIYHNPKCGTSRNVLALIRNSGDEPEVTDRASIASLGVAGGSACAPPPCGGRRTPPSR